ncbi:hypothetical protein R1sor_021643 [Riccia sorocarpa]|uniref:FAS1 domain-containing protein n=1 Tax=Riccia sorocarpa TaxID=122646 RepID=A0ABD3GJJ3_9MARC
MATVYNIPILPSRGGHASAQELFDEHEKRKRERILVILVERILVPITLLLVPAKDLVRILKTDPNYNISFQRGPRHALQETHDQPRYTRGAYAWRRSLLSNVQFSLADNYKGDLRPRHHHSFQACLLDRVTSTTVRSGGQLSGGVAMGSINVGSILLLLFVATASAQTTNTKFNVTTLLDAFPNFTVLNQLLSSTKVADEINSRDSLTLLAVTNDVISAFKSSNPNADVSDILRFHVLLQFLGLDELNTLSPASYTSVTTLLQTTGRLPGNEGELNIYKLPSGILFGASTGTGSNASYVANITRVSYDISILQVDRILVPATFGQASPPAPPPSPVAPATPASGPAPTSGPTTPASGPAPTSQPGTPTSGPAPTSQPSTPTSGPASTSPSGPATPTSGPAPTSPSGPLTPTSGPAPTSQPATPTSGPAPTSQPATPTSGPAPTSPSGPATPTSGPAPTSESATPTSGPAPTSQPATPASGPAPASESTTPSPASEKTPVPAPAPASKAPTKSAASVIKGGVVALFASFVAVLFM